MWRQSEFWRPCPHVPFCSSIIVLGQVCFCIDKKLHIYDAKSKEQVCEEAMLAQ